MFVFTIPTPPILPTDSDLGIILTAGMYFTLAMLTVLSLIFLKEKPKWDKANQDREDARAKMTQEAKETRQALMIEAQKRQIEALDRMSKTVDKGHDVILDLAEQIEDITISQRKIEQNCQKNTEKLIGMGGRR